MTAIEELGFNAPTPIQEKAIPHLLQDDSDFVGLAQTGTGKTAAFGLPLISKVKEKSKLPQGLVICPTRELCLQIAKDLENFAKHLNIRIVAVYGGTDIRRQMNEIKTGAAIVVATPGRLVDLTQRKAISLQEVEWVVLDEADEMLNMGFKEDIDAILEKTPDWKNVWLFSATMPKEVAAIAKNYMENPLEISIGDKNSSNANIDHVFFVIKERDRYAALKRLIDYNPNIYGLVFCRTRIETAKVAENLVKDGYNAEALHGDLSQAQRDSVMGKFRSKTVQVLVATDVAARGIDVDNITHVINYNLPDEVENYTHRSGRTARAGRSGESLVLINGKEHYKIKTIEKIIGAEFTKGNIPEAKEICEIQLMNLVDNVISAEVKENDIKEFLPLIMNEFETMSKEDIVKRFISAEFNRFLEYYERAGDLNANIEKGGSSERSSRRDRKRGDGGYKDENKSRFFVSLGRKDGLNPGGLLRVVCDSTGLTSKDVGRIDILGAFSFFEVDKDHVELVRTKANGIEYEGKTVKIEVTSKGDSSKRSSDRRGPKSGGRSGGNSGGGGRSGGGQGRFRGKSDGRGGKPRSRSKKN